MTSDEESAINPRTSKADSSNPPSMEMIGRTGGGDICAGSTGYSESFPRRRRVRDADAAASSEERRSSDESLVAENAFAQSESRVVPCLRLMMLVVLVVSTVITAMGTYLFTSSSERRIFDDTFRHDARNIFESMGSAMYLWLATMDAYATTAVSVARATNQTWPFVSIPDASVHLAKLRSLGKGIVLHQMHFVTENQREEWEEYTASHNQWALDAVRIQAGDKNYRGPPWNVAIGEKAPMTEFGQVAENASAYLPTWHSAPLIPGEVPYSINAFSYSSANESMPYLFDEKRAVIGRAANIADESNQLSVLEAEAAIAAAQKFIRPEDDASEPLSAIFYPIVDTAADHVSLFNETGQPTDTHSTVGAISLSFFWRDLLNNVLGKVADGIVIVIDNPCGQAWSYQLDGPSVEYLGRGDWHDPAFSYMKQSMDFVDFATRSPSVRQYVGTPLVGGACPYSVHVYGSATRLTFFATNLPKIFTGAVVFIFIFTSAMFLMYDQCVERRQRKIVFTATQSSANVALLERLVRERTRKLEEANRRLEEANRRVVRASAAQLEHFACMSHEIRTPLNCIIGLSSLLLDTELQPMQEESVRMIVRSGDLLLTVVNDVLDYSKLESGNVEINVIRSNLQDTLNNVVQSMETRGQTKRLSIRTRFDPLISEYVHMDYRRVQQILFNLLGNAVKFSFEGGIIELSASLMRGSGSNARELSSVTSDKEQEASREGNFLRFVVKDYGRGIERKDFKTIFQPFRQASAETERVYGGTGLGLAVTAKLIKSLGGRVSVDSQEGEWSEFTVDLPFQDTPVDISLLSSRLRNTTVLLFDDDVANVTDMSRIFRQCSVDFHCFSSMSDMVAMLATGAALPSHRSYVCLVHERLHDSVALHQLERHAATALVSHGPKYAVKESKAHYKSLTHVLPSMLLESFASIVESAGPHVRRSSQEPSFRRLSTGPSNKAPVGALRILIAEDNKINQKVLLRLLKRLNYENVDVVDDGKQACDKVLEKEYDVVLMDIQMPVMNGIEACRVIMGRGGSGDENKDDCRPKPRIIFVTAHVADVFEAECRDAGGVDFLPKPLNIGDIEHCLQRHAQQQPPPSVKMSSSTESTSLVI